MIKDVDCVGDSDDEDEDFNEGDLEEDDDLDEDGAVNEFTLRDWGLCPHGVTDDGDCEECPGGPDGWDD